MELEKIKNEIKKMSINKEIDTQVAWDTFIFDEFINRLSKSEYKNNFIFKGGFYFQNVFGIETRSTMDIDFKYTGDNIINIENKDEIVSDFSKEHEIINDLIHTENGLSYKSDTVDGYCYRDKNGYLDGEMIQYAVDQVYGKYIVMRKVFSKGVQIEYQLFAADGLLIDHEYYDRETSLMVKESFYDKNVMDDINPEVRGNKKYTEYYSVNVPSKEFVDEYKEFGCGYSRGNYSKTIIYSRLDDTLIDESREYIDGIEISCLKYQIGQNGNRYLAFEKKINDDSNVIKKYYYESGKLQKFEVLYDDDNSDAEEYIYGVDEIGPYKIIIYYTNGNYVNQSENIYDYDE